MRKRYDLKEKQKTGPSTELNIAPPIIKSVIKITLLQQQKSNMMKSTKKVSPNITRERSPTSRRQRDSSSSSSSSGNSSGSSSGGEYQLRGNKEDQPMIDQLTAMLNPQPARLASLHHQRDLSTPKSSTTHDTNTVHASTSAQIRAEKEEENLNQGSVPCTQVTEATLITMEQEESHDTGSIIGVMSEIQQHIAPNRTRDQWLRTLNHMPAAAKKLPWKRCKDGYCNSHKELGLAEALTLDTRQGRTRKIRKLPRSALHGNRDATRKVIVNDRFVFACCNGCKEHLNDHRKREGDRGKRTRDNIRTYNLHLDREADEQQLDEIIQRIHWKYSTMNRVRDAMIKCSPGPKQGAYKILPALEIWTNTKKQKGAIEEWIDYIQEEERIGITEKRCASSQMAIPLYIDAQRWAILTLEPSQDTLIARVLAPGIDITRDLHIITRGVDQAVTELFGHEDSLILKAAVQHLRSYESIDDGYDALDNSLVVALLAWRHGIKGKRNYDINSNRSYLESQREKLYLAIEIGKEIEPILALEEMDVQPEKLNEPKDYVWAGTYFAERSNRPEAYINGRDGAAAPSNKRRRR